LVLPLTGVLSLVDDADDPLAARVEVDMPHLDGLAITAAVAIKGVEQIGLQSEQPDCIAAEYVDEHLVHVPVALSQEPHAGKACRDDLRE
jgi:hypothetical protein